MIEPAQQCVETGAYSEEFWCKQIDSGHYLYAEAYEDDFEANGLSNCSGFPKRALCDWMNDDRYDDLVSQVCSRVSLITSQIYASSSWVAIGVTRYGGWSINADKGIRYKFVVFLR